jgi:hypothetical protein
MDLGLCGPAASTSPLGQSTGLGEDSFAKTLVNAYAAFWRKRAYLSFFATEGTSPDRARQIAMAIDSRLH